MEVGAASKQSGPVEPLQRVAGRLLALAQQDWPVLTLAAVFMVSAALAELAIPVYVSRAIALATAASSSADGVAAFRAATQSLLALSLAFGLLSGARGTLFSVANQRLVCRLRERLFAALIKQPTEFFDNNDVGGLTSRLGADCAAVARAVCTNVNVLVRNLLQVLVGGVFLATLSPQLAFAAALASALLWLVTARYGRFSRRAARALQDATATANRVAEEAFSLARTVRGAGTEAAEMSRYAVEVQTMLDINLRQSAAYGLYVVSSTSFYHLAKSLSLFVAGAVALSGAAGGGLSTQQLTTFIMVLEVVLWSSLSVADEWPAVTEALGAGERVLALVSAPPAPQMAAGRVLDTPLTGRVDFVGVTYQYANRPAALQGVNLSIQPGQTVAVVGSSGSGKSTLAALLTRLYDPTSGQVLFDGVPLTDLDAAWFRSQMGIVAQEPRLFTCSIYDNIAYGAAGGVTRVQVEAAARAANAHDFIAALPLGYDTVVGATGLSGGQRQRIAIARALVREPSLLVLDEATSALDAESEALVQAALDVAMSGRVRTCLVIAHRLSTVRRADRIVVLEAGVVVEEGTHGALLRKRGGRYAQMIERNLVLSGEETERDRSMAAAEEAPLVAAPASES